MLTDLREKSQCFGVYILFGILIFVFIFFFGPQADGCQPNAPNQRTVAGWAAQVNGEEISVKEINLAVFRQKQFDRNFPDEAAAIAELSRNTVQQVIEQSILEQQARKMGINVDETALTQFIVSKDNTPDYLLFRDRQGRFQAKEFRNVLSGSLGTSPEIYRRAKRRELIVRRYVDFLASSVKVSEAEIREEFDNRNRTWNLEYVEFDPKTYASAIPAPSEADTTAFAKQSADKVKGHYEKNKARYQREKQVRISRILIRKPKATPKDPTKKATVADAKKRAEDLLKKAKAEGADFAAIAGASSEGYAKKKGGDLGWKNSKSPGYDLFKGMTVGQISELQDEKEWFFFVKATDVKQAINRSLADATPEIAKEILTTEASTKAARKDAEAHLALAKKNNSLASAPPQDGAPAGPAVKTTGPVRQNRADWAQITGIGRSTILAQKLAVLTDKAPLVDEILEVSGRFVVARLKERAEPQDAEFQKQRDSLKTALMSRRADTLFGRWRTILFGFIGDRQTAKRFAKGALFTNLTRGVAIKVNAKAFQAPTQGRRGPAPTSQPTK